MSDPKDKLVLFKEILSLMVVFIGFMTALTTSGVIKNIKVEPVTLIVLIALGLFFVQFLVRVILGEEKYGEIKSKALSTARDFAIVVLVIIGFYFAGKYAAGYNAPSGGQEASKIESSEETGQLSSAPLKNLKKEKPQQHAKTKEKAAAKKGDERPAKTDEKTSRAAEKTSKPEEKAPKTEEKPSKTEEKTAKAEEKSYKNEHKNLKAEENAQKGKSEISDSKGVQSAAKALPPAGPQAPAVKDETAEASVAAEIKTGHTGELSIALPAKADLTSEVVSQTPPEPPKKSEPAEKASVKIDATAETAVHAAAETSPVQAKPAEPVVINVIAEEPPAAPVEKKMPPEEPVAAEQAPKAASAGESSEVITYKMTKAGDEEDNTEDISEAGTTVKFEQTSAELRDKVNNDKVMIKKEYEINKTPSGIKNAGEKVIEGGKKIFDGGANLLEKAGQGIKKQINKVIK